MNKPTEKIDDKYLDRSEETCGDISIRLTNWNRAPFIPILIRNK